MNKLAGNTLLFIFTVVALNGCALGKRVEITSDPTSASVYSNGILLGKTPLTATVDDVMPTWMSDGINTSTQVVIKKVGYEDFRRIVTEFSFPDIINAKLSKIEGEGYDKKQTSVSFKRDFPPADISLDIPEGYKAGRYDIAVVIGNKNYRGANAPDIDYADRDANIMRDYLIRTMGYDSENIIYLEDASLTKLYEVFGTKDDYRGQLYKWVKPGNSKVFIYYVGHGAPDVETAEAYFVPVDANPQHIRVSGYSLTTFYNNLAKIDALQTTVVIDACFSGATPNGTLFKGTSGLVRQEKVAPRQTTKITMFTSSSGDQFSSWYPEKRHSLFTYYFLKGISGKADLNNDKVIAIGEMQRYLADHVPYMARRLTGNEQTPQVLGNPADVLVRLK